jgi:glyoxylase-like metal-dependent hydrolase (beta-lactamase superfamily II)
MYNVKVLTFSPIQENTHVLFNNEKDAIIVDPGCYGEEEEAQLKHFIDNEGLQPRILLNTHCHLDHVFGMKFVAETWKLIPHIHRLEKPILEYGPVAGLMWNLPFDVYNGELAYLEEGGQTGLVGDPLEIFFTPGHSPGSLSFYSASSGFVISGDLLFRGSIGRTDLPGGDFGILSSSIREKLYTLPDQTVVYPGHGGYTTIGSEKKNNPFVKG